MNCGGGSYDSYSANNLKFKLYDSVDNRNDTFGYDYTLNHRVNTNYQNTYFTPSECAQIHFNHILHPS